jgi:hypothetical protein
LAFEFGFASSVLSVINNASLISSLRGLYDSLKPLGSTVDEVTRSCYSLTRCAFVDYAKIAFVDEDVVSTKISYSALLRRLMNGVWVSALC